MKFKRINWSMKNALKSLKTAAPTIFLMLVIASPNIALATYEYQRTQAERETPEPEEIWENDPTSGMMFSTEYVDEEYEYDDAYCIVYTDPDMDLYECEICVDLETYQMVMKATETGKHIAGSLVLNDDYTTENVEVYTYMPNPEYDMAIASAKR